MALLVEEYELDKTISKDLILNTIGSLENRSPIRAFLLRIAHSQHLEL